MKGSLLWKNRKPQSIENKNGLTADTPHLSRLMVKDTALECTTPKKAGLNTTVSLLNGQKLALPPYPDIGESKGVSFPYRKSEAVKKEFDDHTCSTFFIKLFNQDGHINKNAGKDLIAFLCTT
jgi:hypothetical protein